VAQTIHIPVSFEFRTTKVQWTVAYAHVIGWRKPEGTEGHAYLAAEVAGAGGKKAISVPLSRLDVAARNQCLATIGNPGAEESVKEICSGLELTFFVHDHRTYIDDAELAKNSQPADAWLMREDFLRCKPDSKAALAFLNQWGRWRDLRGVADLAEIIDLQRAVREALISPPERWLASPRAFPTMKRARSAEFPYFVIMTDACEVAIRMATTFDLLREMQFKTCARHDCGVPFPVTSNHKREYCSQYCGHLESVRRTRKAIRQGGR
jgi:hypothetical protein